MDVKALKRISLDGYLTPLITYTSIHLIKNAVKFPDHSIPQYHIHYLFKGEETWTLKDGSVIRITGGHIGILQPNVYHGCECGVMYPATILSLAPSLPIPESFPVFSKQQAADIFQAFKKAGNTVINAPASLENMFLSLFNLVKDSKEKEANGFYHAKVTLLLAQIVVDIAEALSSPPEKTDNRIVEKAKQIIEQNLYNDLKASDIVRQAGIKQAHFYELFRKATGRTPADYHLWLRCNQARKMLVDSSAPITEIAYKLNFSSSQHFSTCFKKNFGATPLKYRKANRSKKI